MGLKRASVANQETFCVIAQKSIYKLRQGDTFTSRQYKVKPENGKKFGSPSLYYRHHRQMF